MLWQGVSELYYQLGTELGNDHLMTKLPGKARNTARIERDET
jgi:hypothetical protein